MHHPNIPELYIDAYDADPDDPEVPEWAEVTIDVHDPDDDSDLWQLIHMSMAQARELRDAIDHVARIKGASIMEMLWESLDDLTGRLVDGIEDDDEAAATKHRAEGIAWALAVMTNPTEPSLDAIREQAMERYESAQ